MAENLEAAMKLPGLLQDTGFKLMLNVKLIQRLLKQGRRKEALTIWRESLDEFKHLKDEDMRRLYYGWNFLGDLAGVLLESGELDAALESLEHVPKVGGRVALIPGLIRQMLGAGKAEEAVRILKLEKMEADAEYSRLVTDVVVGLADANKGELALAELAPDRWGSVLKWEDQSRAQAALAKWHARRGEFREALELMGKCSSHDKLDAYATILVEYESTKTPGGKKLPLETLVTWPEQEEE